MDSHEPIPGVSPHLDNTGIKLSVTNISEALPKPEESPTRYLDQLFESIPGSNEFNTSQRKLHEDLEHLKNLKSAGVQTLQLALENTVVVPILRHLQSHLGGEISSRDYLRQLKLADELLQLSDTTTKLTPKLRTELEEFIKKYRTTQYRVIDESNRPTTESIMPAAESTAQSTEAESVISIAPTAEGISMINDLRRLGIPEKFLENKTILELLKRLPPETIDSDSSLSFEDQRVRINGVDYHSLQFEKDAEVGRSQIEGTGRMVCFAGDEVIKVDRHVGNNRSGGIVEVQLWEKAQESLWLREQLLPLKKWGFVKGTDKYKEGWYVYVVFPKVSEFYPASVNLRLDWDTQDEVADLAGGITVDASGSNIGRYNGKWVIVDYNAPVPAIIFGGPEYYTLLQDYASCIKELSGVKRNKPEGWYEKYNDLYQTKNSLEKALDNMKNDYRNNTNYFE